MFKIEVRARKIYTYNKPFPSPLSLIKKARLCAMLFHVKNQFCLNMNEN